MAGEELEVVDVIFKRESSTTSLRIPEHHYHGK